MTNADLRGFAPRRILIVDDDEMTLDILAEHYAELGFEVEQVKDGAAGLAAMNRQRPDIVMCDRVMPTLSGAEMLSEIRQRGEEWRSVVFFFVTGLTDRRDRYAMLDLEPDGYLNKPIDFAVADKLLAKALASRLASPSQDPGAAEK